MLYFSGKGCSEFPKKVLILIGILSWLFLTSQDKNWEGEKFHFPNFFNMCALRRTFRLRAMGALSQVKVVCSASCYQLASESLVKVIASEPCSEPPMLLGD